MSSLLHRALRKNRQEQKNNQQTQIDLLLAVLSPIQRRFVLDPRRFKLARCTRRAGKSYADAAYMIIECLRNPNTPVLYAGLTRDSAKEAIWGILIQMLDELQIPYDPHVSTLQIDFPNGSKITVFGCDAQNARNRLRGRKFKLIIFDETGFFAALDPLIYAVLPMLADYGGTLCMTSSPGELLQGFFYEADQGTAKNDWSRYEWTIHDNPLFQKPPLDPSKGFKTRAEEELHLILHTQFKGNAEHPGYKREWLGQWVEDDTALVYPCTDINLIEAEYKMREHMHAIGISLSHPFCNSIVVGRFSPYAREFQILKETTLEDKDPDDLAKFLEKDVEVYKPALIAAHIGDYTEGIVDEMKRRYKFPLVPMDDRDKSFHQRIYANDLKAGYIRLVKSTTETLRNEYGKIVKDELGEEIKGQPNYAANAALSIYRRVYSTALQSYEAPLSEEERHIKQLEDARFVEEVPWYDR